VATAGFKGNKTLFTCKFDVHLRKEPAERHVWSTALCGAETCALRTVEQKYAVSLKRGAGEGWRRPAGPVVWGVKTCYTGPGRTGISCVQLRGIKLAELVTRRNWHLKYVIEGNIEGTGRRGRRRKRLPDDLMEKRGYWELKEEALDRPVWRTRFGSGCGAVVRQKPAW
jgi:hypothetical protein